MKEILITATLILITLSCNGPGQADSGEQQDTTTTEIITPGITADGEGQQIYFQASGHEPVWSLTMSDRNISVKWMDDSLKTLTPEPVLAADQNIKRYDIHAESRDVIIEISQRVCVDAMSGDSSPYTVRVQYQNTTENDAKTLEGCGHYLTDYRLQDIWVLERLNGKPMSSSDFGRELPMLEINSIENTFSGSTGCNRMNGGIFYEKGKLRFIKIATTRMMCPRGQELEQQFVRALEASTSYQIANNRLTLSNPDQTLIVFRKAD